MNMISFIPILSLIVIVGSIIVIIISIIKHDEIKLIVSCITSSVTVIMALFSPYNIFKVEITPAGSTLSYDDCIEIHSYTPFSNVYYTLDQSFVQEK